MENKTTTTTTTKKFTINKVINFLAFVAIIFVGLALVLGYIFKNIESTQTIANAFETIANVIAYILVAYFSFLYVRTKRHWAFYLVWSLAIVLIIIFMVLGLVK